LGNKATPEQDDENYATHPRRGWAVWNFRLAEERETE